MSLFRSLLCSMLLCLTGTVFADMCKWVDENGVVHYAETCPENVPGTMVKTQPDPSQAQIKSAQSRSEAMRQQRAAAGKGAEDKQPLTDQPQQSSAWKQQSLQASCELAYRERDLLNFDMPVYRDSNGQLHHQESLHHHFYEGPRDYIEDDQRAEELAKLKTQLSRDCLNVMPAKSNYVYRFIDKPTLEETLDLLMEMLLPEGPSPDEICPYARLMAADLRELKPGIPSNKQRELERLISQHCR